MTVKSVLVGTETPSKHFQNRGKVLLTWAVFLNNLDTRLRQVRLHECAAVRPRDDAIVEDHDDPAVGLSSD
jgi:hypothetical protein